MNRGGLKLPLEHVRGDADGISVTGPSTYFSPKRTFIIDFSMFGQNFLSRISKTFQNGTFFFEMKFFPLWRISHGQSILHFQRPCWNSCAQPPGESCGSGLCGAWAGCPKIKPGGMTSLLESISVFIGMMWNLWKKYLIYIYIFIMSLAIVYRACFYEYPSWVMWTRTFTTPSTAFYMTCCCWDS